MSDLTPSGRCANCDGRYAEGDDFDYRGYHFCAECMSALCSWFLDGGVTEDPEQFAWVEP